MNATMLAHMLIAASNGTFGGKSPFSDSERSEREESCCTQWHLWLGTEILP